MRLRLLLVTVAALTMGMAWPAGEVPGERPGTTVCTWGGTPAATTGTFTIKPGITATPSTRTLKFFATGPLEGGPGCTGKMVFRGVFDAGSTCELGTFHGRVKGVPGVARFSGAGNVIAPSVLFDKAGNLVGSEQPQVVTGVGSGSEASDCATDRGFTHGSFSSVLELFGG